MLMKVLALFLMFLAGWVHRDISVGNILAVRADDGSWKVKLADLEYAKKFPSETGSPEPKTVSDLGTYAVIMSR